MLDLDAQSNWDLCIKKGAGGGWGRVVRLLEKSDDEQGNDRDADVADFGFSGCRLQREGDAPQTDTWSIFECL